MSFIFKIKSDNAINNKIIKKKISKIKLKNTDPVITSYFLLKKKLKNLYNNKNIKYLYDSTYIISLKNMSYATKILLNMVNIFTYREYSINDDNTIENKLFINNSFKYNNKTSNNINNTFLIKIISKIRNATLSNDDYDLNDLIIYLYNTIIRFIKSHISNFKNNDNFIFSIYQLDINSELISNLLYLLSLLFNEVIIVNYTLIICLDYNIDNKYINDIINLDEKDYLFVKIKKDIDKLYEYAVNIQMLKKRFIELCIDKDEINLFKELYNTFLSYSHDPFIIKHDHNKLFYKYIQLHLIENSKRIFIKDKNQTTEIKLHSSIKKEEGKNIMNIIKKYNLKICLEIGMAFGISASYILLADKDVNLISIDPFQKEPTQWNSVGLKLLKQLGISERHHYIGEKSYISLPKLLSTYNENYFDFIFIDGWHTFDYTLIDFFYADKLLRIGGIILIDDAFHKGVAKFVRYIQNNYKNYDKIETHKTLAGFKKLKNDTRDWSFHKEF
jgi:predicted O-methyltransferase YrrM